MVEEFKRKQFEDEENGIDERKLSKHIENFIKTIPDEIINLVKIFNDSHWEIIKSISYYSSDFINLIKTNPALAYVLVHLEKFNASFSCYNDIQYLESLIKSKQKKILEIAGFPGVERMVKIFSKMELQIIDLISLIGFRNTLRDDPLLLERILNVLSHSRSITPNLFFILNYEPFILELIPNKVIFQLTKSENLEDELKSLKKILVQSKRWNVRVTKIREAENIKKTEKKVIEEVRVIKNKTDFPLPPFPNNEFIFASKFFY